MIFHNYLEQLLGNRAAISILRALFEHKGMVFTVRRLAETAKISHTEANNIIGRLERLGIIKVQPVGRAYQVSLNEKSYMLENIVRPNFVSEDKTLDALVQALRRHLGTKKIISSAIFGSVAAGQEREDSDIDLLVISDDKDHAHGSIGDAMLEISETFHGRVAPIVFSKKEFITKKRGDLVRSILGNHIMVSGTELGKIAK